jgi:hypothetical protein
VCVVVVVVYLWKSKDFRRPFYGASRRHLLSS